MRKFAVGALLAGVLGAVVAVEPLGPAAAAPAQTTCGGTIGVIAPLTGAAASIGQEIKNWAQLAITNWNAQNHTAFTLLEGDDQLSPSVAATVAQQFSSNQSVLATIGPAASQNVSAAGPILKKADMAMVSPSATATSLTNGSLPDFFRVIANDGTQGPTDANYIAKTLHANRVMVIDDQSTFGVGLAASAAAVLKQDGVQVQRESVAQTAVDYSSLVAKARGASAIFLTWQLPANIKLYVQQLNAQGLNIPTFATTFGGNTNYVSSFAINVHTYAPDAALVRQYQAKYGSNYSGEFGPPSYVSAQVIMTAIGSLCKAHQTPTRASITSAIRKVQIAHSILGRSISFTGHGDLSNGYFYIYKLAGASNYDLVSPKA